MRKALFFGLLMSCLFSCNVDDDKITAYVDYKPKIVVEGWMESGEPAIVMLSWSAPFDRKMDTTFLLNHVIRAAKVFVSDGEQTEQLTLGTNWNHLPPYTYYGSLIKGETGKSYQLRIEYRNQVITADTYIPQPVPLENCRFLKKNPSDTTGYLHISFRNTSDLYYQVTTKVDKKENIYTPCLYGNFNAGQFPKDELVSLQINKGIILYPKPSINAYFIAGDTIYLKFRTQPKEGYDFWTSWQNEVLNGQNPIFPANTSLKSNIIGGIGIWCGYGSYTYRIDTQ